ncbi:molybdenum cofactor guanylyltransferase [Marinobacterium zhoushanense]|uniref:Molybdenum cofactor guanylyltransferase n=1 Tax=Marinobacterium zhoushanense TaxID=1679163 RepID=A0ABQ1KL60_9GAMM|nr:molybdenum cofactor guanylyltransferase MobA [Marinobacterium zhoushanense]GGB99329.1 molybdenum cofactor guanylyltransferase [Marinobacterium zhoushanense]
MSGVSETGMTALAAVILAGGQGRRMGGCDKGLVPFRQVPMVSWSLVAAQAEVTQVLISCNRNPLEYARLGVPLVQDRQAGFNGPLSGIQAAMAALEPEIGHLLVLPCDTPLISGDLVRSLIDVARRNPAHIVHLRSEGQPHYLHAVIPCRYRDSLDLWLESGQQAVGRWYAQHPVMRLAVDEQAHRLLNLNSPEQLRASA